MNCNVLIVDDSPILRSAIAKVARLAGVPEERIFFAGDGAKALEVLEKQWIDLVLLDLNMPVMDGEEFARRLRANAALADTKVVIVSTESNQDRLDRLRALGISEALRKPFQPEDLCQILVKLLGANPCAN
ncbi:MAG: response regulator [Phycisphaerae bacterium]|nr:response regulator [Phycisphaerae bacterium]